MAAGVTQPGGAGTTIFVYDNTHGDAGGDGSYSFADILAAMNLLRPGQSDIEGEKGSVSGNIPARTKYMINVSIQLGGGAGDGSLITTFKETNCDVDWRTGAMLYRSGGGVIETRLGTQTGVGPLGLAEPTMGGKDGVNINSGSWTFKNDLFIFGCKFICTNVYQVQTIGASTQTLAGNTFVVSGVNNVFGDSNSLGLWYNNVFVFTTTSGNAINGMRQQDGRGNKVFCTTPLQILSASQATARIQGMNLSGVPSVAYLKPTATDASDWKIIDVIFQDDSPRISYSVDHTIAQALQQFGRINTHIEDGTNPLANIPVRLVSSVATDDGAGGSNGGVVVDTKTFGDGDLGFTHGPSGYANGVLLREYYRSGGVNLVRDRTFTLYVNYPGGAYAPNTAYGKYFLVFQWPGINTFKGTYQAGGGTFTGCFLPITLAPAAGPTANFGSDKGGGPPPLAVQFMDESIAGDQPITAWAWDFGDGGTSTAQNPSHTYTVSGAYTVSLTVTTLVGPSTKTYSTMIYVQSPAPPPVVTTVTVDSLPLPADGVERIEATVPQTI